MKLEKMDDFFNARVDSYDNHMMENVEGARVYYKETARYLRLPKNARLLDLGCGTGLELDEILPLNPTLEITGIDMSQQMLEKLMEKHSEAADRIKTICGDYFEAPFGQACFDAAVSVQTMHHFDIPMTVEHQREILLKAGFKKVEHVYNVGCTSILIAYK